MPRQDHDDLHGRLGAKPGATFRDPLRAPQARLVVVTGGRDRHQDREDALWLRAWLRHIRADVLGHGDCAHSGCMHGPGCTRLSVDRWAGECARRLGLGVRAFPARWDLHGREAGPLRNLEMLAAVPCAVLAFPGARGLSHRGRHTGAGHTVYHARRLGIPTWIRGMDDPDHDMAGR